MRVVHLIDSRDYVATNCFQHQLLAHLLNQKPLYIDITIDEIRAGVVCPPCDIILSTLKLRTLARELRHVKRLIGEQHIYVYDQDPWEAFVDNATFRGAYHSIAAELSVAAFLVTSRWWANHIRLQNLPARFVRMWPLSQYCDQNTQWSKRPIEVGFKGTLHPHRRKSVEYLAKLGVNVTVLPSGSYAEFLHDLSRMQFFFHDESGEKWHIDGTPVERNCVWIKEVEAMARGCIAIRVDDEESQAYCAGLPALRAVKSLDDVPSIIDAARNNQSCVAFESASTVKKIVEMPQTMQWINLATIDENAHDMCL